MGRIYLTPITNINKERAPVPRDCLVSHLRIYIYIYIYTATSIFSSRKNTVGVILGKPRLPLPLIDPRPDRTTEHHTIVSCFTKTLLLL